MSLAAVQQAERTQSGIIRLSESGLAAVGHEAALLEVRAAAVPGQTHQRDAFNWPRRAVRLAQRLRSVGSFQAAALTVRLASACAWGWLAGRALAAQLLQCLLRAGAARQVPRSLPLMLRCAGAEGQGGCGPGCGARHAGPCYGR